MIRFGLTNEIIALPITLNLTVPQDSEFEFKEQSLQQNYIDLIQGKLDAGFIAASDYAKDSTLLKLVKDIAIYSRGESRYSLLFFQKDLVDITEVAYHADSHYNDVAHVLLNEFYEAEPEWKLVQSGVPVERLLEHYQSALKNGTEALENYFGAKSKIDILDQWWDKTELSFVHQVIGVHRNFTETKWMDRLYKAGEEGSKNLEELSQSLDGRHGHSSKFYLDLLRNAYHYDMDDKVWKECGEYFKYLFYYGRIPFIPEFHFV